MPILFSAVAHESKLISKYASCDGNFNEILDEVLAKTPLNDHKMTYSHGHYLLHNVTENKCLYFCITTKKCQRSRAFLYLNEIKRRFNIRNKQFYHVLASEMQRYSEDYSTIVVRKGELDELNNIGVGSSESILGEKILYVNNYENLSFSSVSYIGETPQKSSVTMDTEANSTKGPVEGNIKFYLFLGTVILVLIWLAVSTYGPVTVVIIACIFVLSFVKLKKLDKNT